MARVDAALRDAAGHALPPAEPRRVDGRLLRSTPCVSRGRLNSAEHVLVDDYVHRVAP